MELSCWVNSAEHVGYTIKFAINADSAAVLKVNIRLKCHNSGFQKLLGVAVTIPMEESRQPRFSNFLNSEPWEQTRVLSPAPLPVMGQQFESQPGTGHTAERPPEASHRSLHLGAAISLRGILVGCWPPAACFYVQWPAPMGTHHSAPRVGAESRESEGRQGPFYPL